MAKSKHMKDAIKLMGKIVTTSQVYNRRRDPNYFEEIKWNRENLPKPRSGWVVGKISLQNGTYTPGSANTGTYYYDDET